MTKSSRGKPSGVLSFLDGVYRYSVGNGFNQSRVVTGYEDSETCSKPSIQLRIGNGN